MLYCKDLQSLIFRSNHSFHRRILLGLMLPLHLKDEQIKNNTGLITRYCHVLKEYKQTPIMEPRHFIY